MARSSRGSGRRCTCSRTASSAARWSSTTWACTRRRAGRPSSGCASTSSASCARSRSWDCRSRRRQVVSEAIVVAVRANPGANVDEDVRLPASIEVDVVPLDEHVSLAIAAYDPVADIIAHKAVKPRVQPAAAPLDREGAAQPPRTTSCRRRRRSPRTTPRRWSRSGRRAARGYDDILLVDEHGFVAEAPTSNVFLSIAAGALRTPPEDDGAARRHAQLDSRDRARRGAEGGRGEVPPRGALRGGGGRSSPARPPASGRSRRSTTARSPAARRARSSARLGARFQRDRRRRGSRTSALAHRRRPAKRACASSPASSPRASLHIGNYFGAMRQHVALQAQRRVALLHRRLPLDDERARRARAPPLHARRRARLPGAAASIPSARSSSASRDVPEVCELAWLLVDGDADGPARARALVQGQGRARAVAAITGCSPIRC